MEVVVDSDRETGETMDQSVLQAIENLRNLTIADLQNRYRELFGEEAKCPDKPMLLRRIVWRLQAAVEGELSERARRRAAEIADDADLHGRAPENSPAPSQSVVRSRVERLPSRRDPRVPPPGTLLARRIQGRDVVVKILDDGFEYQGQRYGSLSAIAREVTGTRWNGFTFFGLAARRNG